MADARVPQIKTCRACGVEKELSEFYSRPNSKNGRRATCKACCTERRAKRGDVLRARALAAYYKAKASGTFVRYRNPEKDKEYRRKNKAKQLERAKAWREQNPERTKANGRAWYQANKERARRWASEHPDRRREIQREWSRRNPLKRAINTSKRRARLLAAPGAHTVQDVIEIRERQKDLCAYCKVRLNGKGHLDHVQPLTKGGSNDRRNLQYLCAPCNQKKNARDPLDYARSIGLLL